MADNEIEIRVKGKDVSAAKTFAGVKDSAEDAASGFDKAGDAADGAEGKAQGFSDTLTGTADVMSGAGAIAKGNLFEGFVTLGGGMADLAGGMASFLIPALKNFRLSAVRARAATIAQSVAAKAAAATQWLLNAALAANPIGLVIAAIVGLVAVIVIAYKKSETFRRIVDGAFRAVKNGAAFALGWVKQNWPLLLAILTGPFGLAVLVIVRNKDAIVETMRKVPGKVKGFFRGLGSFISEPFTTAFGAVKSMWNSTVGGFGFEVPGWVPKVGGKEFRIPEMARGGIGGGFAIVGERGRELVRLPHGSTVIPNGRTEAMLAGAGGGGGGMLPVTIVLDGKALWHGLLKVRRDNRGPLGFE